MIHAASRRALDELRAREHEVLEGRISVQTLTTVAEQLYSVARLLVAQPQLRRLLADPATAPESRSGLAEQVFSAQLDRSASALLLAATTLRWSSAWDFVDAIEQVGDDAVFRAAEKDNKLDTIEDELFRLERIITNRGDLVALLDEQAVPAERRIGLLDSLVAEKVQPLTLTLLHNAVASTRKRSVLLAIDDLLESAARWQERSVARVTSAVELDAARVDRLAAALTQMYGRPIVVRVAVDPSLRGGLVVRVGDEVIDGSVTTKLQAARTALAT